MNDKTLPTEWLNPTKGDSYKFEEVELRGERIFNFHILDEAGKTDHTLTFTEPILESIHNLEINSPDVWISLMNLTAETTIIKRLFETRNIVVSVVKWMNTQTNVTMNDLAKAANIIKKDGDLEALTNTIKEGGDNLERRSGCFLALFYRKMCL